MIRSDNHVHTSFSTDSNTPIEKMLERAIELGLSSICFTDHMDYDFPVPENEPDMNFLFDPDAYLKEIESFRDKYPQLEIRQGVELGLQPHITEQCLSLSTSYPFDFIIGSTHVVRNIDPYYDIYWEGSTEKKGLLDYYEATLKNISAGADFDVYGHIDYIIRYTPKMKTLRNAGAFDEDYHKSCLSMTSEIIDEILKQLLAKGKGIEINTGGLKYGLGHTNPHEWILKRYRELGGELITIGSDAHEPKHLAYEFMKASDILKSCGFRYYTEFKNRKPQMFSLD